MCNELVLRLIRDENGNWTEKINKLKDYSKKGLVWVMYGFFDEAGKPVLIEVGKTKDIVTEINSDKEIIMNPPQYKKVNNKSHPRFRQWSEKIDGYDKRKYDKYRQISKDYSKIELYIAYKNINDNKLICKETHIAMNGKAKYWYPMGRKQWKFARKYEKRHIKVE